MIKKNFILFKIDKFQLYDFQAKKNMEIYNQTTPPLYNISNINVKTQIIYGVKDFISPPSVSVN